MDLIPYYLSFFLSLSTYLATSSLMNSISGWVVMGVCVGHWISCLIYICVSKTHFYGGLVWSEWFFKIILSIISILTFMNVEYVSFSLSLSLSLSPFQLVQPQKQHLRCISTLWNVLSLSDEVSSPAIIQCISYNVYYKHNIM